MQGLSMSDSIRSKIIKLAASYPTGSSTRRSLLEVLVPPTKSVAATSAVEVPDWLKVGIRVRKNGGWPRVGLLDGTEGTVKSLDISDNTGLLRSFTVVWDGLEDHKRGVEHYGWHATDGSVTPLR